MVAQHVGSIAPERRRSRGQRIECMQAGFLGLVARALRGKSARRIPVKFLRTLALSRREDKSIAYPWAKSATEAALEPGRYSGVPAQNTKTAEPETVWCGAAQLRGRSWKPKSPRTTAEHPRLRLETGVTL